MPKLSKRAKQILAIVVALLASVGVMVVITDKNGDSRPDEVTITLGPPAQERADVPDKITAPAGAVKLADQSPELDPVLKDATPPGVPDAQLDKVREAEDRLAATDQLPIVTPDAAPSQRGCASRFVRNYNSRRGVRPRLIVAHETVSANLPGTADLRGLTALANNPAAAVSWTYNIDRDGNCFYIVREFDNAWTQAAANRFSIGIEFVNSTFEVPFLKPAGYRKAGLVISDAARRWKIPLRRGKVHNCIPVRSGIVTHRDLGLCGGVASFNTGSSSGD
jgi:hypothetical protein